MGSNIPFSASAQESSFFTPLMIPSLALWFDAADVTTITLSAGTVSEWRDKSSNAYSVFQPNASYRPNYTTNLLNGLPGVQLSGTRYLYQLGSNMPNFSSSPATTVYMVAKNGSTLAPLGWNFLNTMTFIGPLSGTPRYFFSFYEENTPRLSLYTNDVLAGFNSSYFVPLNSNAIIGFAASATSNYLFFNGSNTAFTSTGAPPSANNETWFFFGDDNSNYVTDENIYEFVGFNTLLTSAQQQAVEGYLATKWGLQSSLSNGHPYKTTPLPFAPTFVKSPPYPTSVVNNPQFDPRLIPGCQLWLDAADATTFTLTSGSNVSTWSDKSGSNSSLSNTTSNPPYFTTYNGYPTVSFRGSLSSTSNVLSNQTFSIAPANISIFIITQALQNGSGYIYPGILTIFPNPLSGVDYQNGLTIDGGNNTSVIMEVYGGGSTGSGSGIGYSGSGLTPHGVYSFVNTSNVLFAYANGTQWGTNTFTFNTTNVGIALGMRHLGSLSVQNGASAYDGNISEVIIYNTALTTTQRQQVEAYLAYKWKLNPLLSTQNRYAPGSYLTFVNPPRIPALPMRRAAQSNKFLPPQIPGCQLWLDAADATTITGTTSITAWRDKSGSNNNAIFSGTNPSYVAASNAVITANLNQRFTVPAATIATSTGSGSIFMVYGDQQTQGGAYAALFGTANPGSSFYQLLIRPDTGSYQPNGTIISAATSNAFNTTNTLLYTMNYTYNSTSGSVRLNGTTYVSSFSGSPPVPSGALTLSGVGWGDTGNVRLYEILTYVGATPLTPTQQQQIEGYLAWKWRLKASLPPDHPFFLIPPLPLS